VISKRIHLRFNRPANGARILSLLLLASIGWCTTAEFTHHHGTQAGSRFGALSSTREQAAAANPTNPARAQVSDDQRSSSTTRSAADCLICQLHQNLASTLFDSPPRIVATRSFVLSKPAQVTFQVYEFAANQHGRAPPVNL